MKILIIEQITINYDCWCKIWDVLISLFEIISDCFVVVISIFYYFYISIKGNLVYFRKNKLSGIRLDNSKYPAKWCDFATSRPDTISGAPLQN